jgi:hypothetical protein
MDITEQAHPRGGVKLARRVRDGLVLCAAATVLACNADPAPTSGETAADEAPLVESADERATLACERIREEFSMGECRGVMERWRVLGCETAAPDDPACVEQTQARQACRAKIIAFAQAHDDKIAENPEDLVDPSQWSCEYPQPMPKPRKPYEKGFSGLKSPRVLEPLTGEQLIMTECAKQYAHLKNFPNVDRAVLEHVWRSDECRRRHDAVLGVLANGFHTTWAAKWASSTPQDETEPWRLSSDIDAPTRERLIAAVDAWCAGSPCRVLGRCAAGVLPAEHPTFPAALTCVARDDAACKQSEACAAEGRCRFDADTESCVPGSDDDCARSTLCTERKLCRAIEALPYGKTCGGTMPATSGADSIGLINNSALGTRAAVVEIENESIQGPHAKVMVGLSPAQLADVSACVELSLIVDPALNGSLQLVIDIAGTESSRIRTDAPRGAADAGRLGRCIQRESAAWRFPAAKGNSRLTFSARVHGR